MKVLNSIYNDLLAVIRNHPVVALVVIVLLLFEVGYIGYLHDKFNKHIEQDDCGSLEEYLLRAMDKGNILIVEE